MRDDAIDVRVQRILAAAGTAFLQVVCGLLCETAQSDATVIRIIRIIPAAIGNRGDGVRAIHGIIPRAVHRPRSTFQGFALGIDLIPLDCGAGGGHLPIPRQVMTFLIHIHCRGGIFAFGVDEIAAVCGNDILVVHFKIASSPHTTISGDMRLEIALGTKIIARYHNGTHPCGRRIISYIDAIPVFLVAMLLILVPAGVDAPRPLTTKNRKGIGVIEVPHQLACALDVLLPMRIVVAVCARRIHHDVAVGDINVVPLELPAITELHIIAITVDVDGDRSIVGDVLEVEHHAGITNAIQH